MIDYLYIFILQCKTRLLIKISTVNLFLLSLILTSSLFSQRFVASEFAFQQELEAAIFKDLDSGQGNAGNYAKLIFEESVSSKETEQFLKNGLNLLYSPDLYSSGGESLIPVVYFSTIEHLYKLGDSVDKVVQNVTFQVFAELYRKYGKEEILFQMFANVSADLFEGIIQTKQLNGLDYDSLEMAHFKGLLQGGYQVAKRLGISHMQYFEPWLKEVNTTWLRSSNFKNDSSYEKFIHSISGLILAEFSRLFSTNQSPVELLAKVFGTSLTFYNIEKSESTTNRFGQLCKGLSAAVWDELAPDREVESVEGLVIANYVGNIGVMDKSSRQFLPKDRLFAGLELVGDYSFLTSQYSSVVLLLKNGAIIQLSEQTQVQVDHDGENIYVHVDYGNLFFDTSNCHDDQPLILRSNTGFIQLTKASGEFSLTPHSLSNNSSGVLKMLEGEGLYKGNNGRFVPIKERENIHLVIDRTGKQLISADVFPMTTMEQRMIDGFSLRTSKIIDRLKVLLSDSDRSKIIPRSDPSQFRNQRSQELSAVLEQDALLFETRLKEKLEPIAGVICGAVLDTYYALNKKDETLKRILSATFRAQLDFIAEMTIENSIKIELFVGSARSLAMHGMQPGFSMASLREKHTIHLLGSAVLEEAISFIRHQDLSFSIILDVIKREFQKAVLIEADIYRRKEEKIKTYLAESTKIALETLEKSDFTLSDSEKEALMKTLDFDN